MAKNSDSEPKPPKIPAVGDKISQQPLDGWINSEDPQEGFYTGVVVDGNLQKIDHNDDCDCPACNS